MQGSGFRLDVNTESQNLSHTRLLTSLILSPEAALTLTRHSDTHIVYVEWTANGVGPGVVIYHRLSLSDGIAARLLPNRSGTSGPLVTSVIYAEFMHLDLESPQAMGGLPPKHAVQTFLGGLDCDFTGCGSGCPPGNSDLRLTS